MSPAARGSAPAAPSNALATRSDAAELMDTECADAADYARCLRDLSRANTLTLARRPTLAWLGQAARECDARDALSVYDVAYGHGDMLRAVAGWAKRRGRAVRLGGIDLNPGARTAALAASPGLALDLAVGDVFAADPGRPDVIISSLFTHHLSDAQVVAFLRWMERHARLGWFINDLHRHRLPHLGFCLLARAMGWHRFVGHDGTVSIARAFRPREWESLLRQAGVPGTVRRRFPFRLCVSRLR